jgi:hypothetical protein
MDIVKLEPAFPEPLGEPRNPLARAPDSLPVRALRTAESLEWLQHSRWTHSLLSPGISRGVEVYHAHETSLRVQNLVAAIQQLVERRDLLINKLLRHSD